MRVFVVAASIRAQTTTGSITGLVTDTGGGIVPGSALTLTNLSTNQVRKQTAKMRLALTRLRRFRRATTGWNWSIPASSVSCRSRSSPSPAQQTVTLNLTLEVGQVTQILEVTGHAELLDAATSSLSQVVENRQVTELPLNGRNTLALVSLTPGIRTQAGFLQNTAVRSYARMGQLLFERRIIRGQRSSGRWRVGNNVCP